MITQDLIQLAKNLYENDKMSLEAIGIKLNVSRNELRKEFIKNNIPRRKPTELKRSLDKEIERDVVHRYTTLNESVRKLSRDYECDRCAIMSILKRNCAQFRSISEANNRKFLDKEKIKEMFVNKCSLSEIAKKFGVHNHAITYHLRKMGIKREDFPRKETVTEIKKTNVLYQYFLEGKTLYYINEILKLVRFTTAKRIIQNYLKPPLPKQFTTTFPLDKIDELVVLYKTKNYSVSDLCKKFNSTQVIIVRILKKKLGKLHDSRIHNQRYSLNENYFKDVGAREKHFIMGLLLTDGSNAYSKRKYCTALGLTGEDIATVKYFTDQLEFNRPPVYNPKKNFWVSTITNKTISMDLKSLGCIEDKSHLLEYPNWIKDEYFNSFLLGCIFGDGWITKPNQFNKGGFHIGMVGTEKFLQGCFFKLKEVLGVRGSFTKCNDGESKRIGWSGAHQVLKICNYLFKDAPFLMKRKFLIYEDLIEYKKIAKDQTLEEKGELEKALIIQIELRTKFHDLLNTPYVDPRTQIISPTIDV
jgi:DNA-binding MarR family transcriptional regulator